MKHSTTRRRSPPSIFMSAGTSVLGMTPLAIFFRDRDLNSIKVRNCVNWSVFYNSDSTVVLWWRCFMISQAITDHKITRFREWNVWQNCFTPFCQLTGRITDQHVCLVCGHVWVISTNPISAGYIDYGRRVSPNSRYIWFFLGSLVDRYKKKTVMLSTSFISIRLHHFICSTAVFTDPSSVILWVFIILVLVGAIAGNIRTITCLPTCDALRSRKGKSKWFGGNS